MSKIAKATDTVQSFADQINNTTDCAALTLVFERHLESITDLVEEKLQTQLDIIKNHFPLLDVPTSITDVIEYIKKQVLGTAYQQLKAFLKNLKQIAELQKALIDLIQAIEQAGPRLKECLEDSIIEGIKFDIQTRIDALTAPIDEALATVDTLQTQINNIIDNPLDPYIVTDSIDTFLATADEGLTKLGVDIDEFNAKPTASGTPVLNGDVDIANTETITYVGGVASTVVAANTG